MSDDRGLLWDLFLIVRELENRVGEPGRTAEHTKRQQEWAAKFHAAAASYDPSSSPADAEHDEDPAEDPHEHGTPVRRRRRR